MGCARFKYHKHKNSKKFEMEMVREAAEARGIGWDKVCKRIPQITKVRMDEQPDYMTQIEISNYLKFPLPFFFQKLSSIKIEGWVCGEGVKACAFCGVMSEFFCDFPIGDGRTCDLPMCKEHKKHRPDIGQDIDYCPHHW